MLRVIIFVALGALLLVYGMLFATWNMTPVTVIGFQIGDDAYGEKLPVMALPLVGLVVGLVVMAVAVWSEWSAQRKRAAHAAAQIERAKEKLQKQHEAIVELREEVERLNQELQTQEHLQAGNEPPEDLIVELSDEAGDESAATAEDDDEDVI